MSQHSLSIANEAGAAFRADVNNALQALASRSSGASAPATTYAYQPWCDTTNGVLKQRNAANSAWIIRDTLAETRVISRSSNTIIGIGDYGCTFLLSSTFTQTLTAAATLADGWHCYVRNNGSGVITVDPNSTETIDGGLVLTLNPGEGCRISCNGTIFTTIGLRQPPATVNNTPVGTPANTSENDLQTLSVPANALLVNGRGVRIRAWGTISSGAGSRTPRLYFGSTLLSAVGSSGAGAWTVEAVVLRSGANAQTYGQSMITNGSAFGGGGTSAQTETSAITIKTTGQSSNGAANDVVSSGLIYEMI